MSVNPDSTKSTIYRESHESAIQLALGYAWGREDASGTVTAAPMGGPSRVPSSAFAEAFAAGWDEYNQERRGHMTNVRSAYERWQASNGRTIWDEHTRPAKPAADTILPLLNTNPWDDGQVTS